MPEARVRSIAAEVAYLQRRFPDGGRGLEQLIQRACHAWGSAAGHEGAWVKRVVWDASSGCHPDGVGYTMYTVRPYLLGWGSDGTVDANVHLLAAHCCAAVGVDVAAAYERAYPEEVQSEGETRAYFCGLLTDQALREETRLPSAVDASALELLVNDLHSINNHCFAAELQALFSALPQVRDSGQGDQQCSCT